MGQLKPGELGCSLPHIQESARLQAGERCETRDLGVYSKVVGCFGRSDGHSPRNTVERSAKLRHLILRLEVLIPIEGRSTLGVRNLDGLRTSAIVVTAPRETKESSRRQADAMPLSVEGRPAGALGRLLAGAEDESAD